MTLHRTLAASTVLESAPVFEPASLEPVSLKGASHQPGVKTVTPAKWDWLDGVLADVAARRMSAAAFCVAFAIAQHVNKRSGEAWPRQKRLMQMTGLSETTLRDHLKALIRNGHIEQLKRGVRNGNKYRLRRALERPLPG